MSDERIDAYPLQWPPNRPRAKWRSQSNFNVTQDRAQRDIVYEVRMLTGGGAPVISTNIPLRKDGLPYANTGLISDPGVAVYFTYKKKPVCFACDRWNSVADNMRAIAKTIEALRGIARWGTGDMVHAAFTGFAALADQSRHWTVVLGVAHDATPDIIDAAFKAKVPECHPDRGHGDGPMIELNNARAAAIREVAA